MLLAELSVFFFIFKILVAILISIFKYRESLCAQLYAEYARGTVRWAVLAMVGKKKDEDDRCKVYFI